MILDGTAWQLEGEWTAAEIAVFEPARVPPEWRALPLVVTHGDRHLPRGRHVELAEVTPYAWVHALAHAWDADTHASRRTDWRRIAGWSRVARDPAAERDPLTFADPRGMEGPAEDLATVAAAYFTDTGDPCSYPSKWRWFEERFGERGDRCPAPEDVGLDPANVESLEIVYIVASPASPASLVGHVLVAVRQRPDARGIARADAWGLVADTSGMPGEGIRYAWNGLTGGFLSRIAWEPHEVTVHRYADGEDRDVRRYRLLLSPEETRRALARLDELRQGWRRPYFFLTHNCVQLPLEVLRAAFGDGFETPTPLTPDVLLSRLLREGHLEALPIERPQEAAIGERARVGAQLRRGIVHDRRLTSRDPVTRATAYASLPSTLSPGDAARVLGWSDPIERRSSPNALEAVRAARADLRSAAGAPLPTGDEALLEELDWDRPGSMHTPFRRKAVTGGWTSTTGGWVGVESTLYASHLGDARRLRLSDGMALTVLATTAGVGEAGLLGSTDFVDMRWSAARPGPWRLGWELDVAHLDWDPTVQRARLVEGRGLLTLWPDPHRGHFLAAGLGISALGERSPDALSAGIGVPLTLDAQLADRHSPLTTLRASARWTPTLATDGLSLSEEASVAAGLHLGELHGTDYGVELRGAERREWGAWGGSPPQKAEWSEVPVFSAGVAVVIERY